MTSKETTISHWIRDAQDLKPGDQLNIYLWDHAGPPPNYSDMRSALYAQFGDDTSIRIWKHGQRICVFIPPDDDERDRFDRRSARIVIKGADGRKEIENGFVRLLDVPPPKEESA